MNMNQFQHIQDPIARAEAMRAQAIAEMITDSLDGLRDVVKAGVAKLAAYLEYRRTFALLSGMTDRELDDIGICRAEIAAVARGHDPRRQSVAVAGDALARRMALAEAFEQGDETEVRSPRVDDHRTAAAA
jgi:uncharacterized protein YjiS (DUF1127 family)